MKTNTIYTEVKTCEELSNHPSEYRDAIVKIVRSHAVNELYGTNVSPDEYAQMWNNQYYDSDLSWAEIAKGVDLLDQVGSFDAASIAKDLGADLQQVADTISQAAAVGISTDLEAAAQGLGYDSFADAVAAYNKQYGTNYTVDEAREALGQ